VHRWSSFESYIIATLIKWFQSCAYAISPQLLDNCHMQAWNTFQLDIMLICLSDTNLGNITGTSAVSTEMVYFIHNRICSLFFMLTLLLFQNSIVIKVVPKTLSDLANNSPTYFSKHTSNRILFAQFSHHY
jgi:hypothetical protein